MIRETVTALGITSTRCAVAAMGVQTAMPVAAAFWVAKTVTALWFFVERQG